MSSESKKPSEKQIQEQKAKKSGEKCDYLHPEECGNDSKESLEKTRKEVTEEAEQFIKEKNESDEA